MIKFIVPLLSDSKQYEVDEITTANFDGVKAHIGFRCNCDCEEERLKRRGQLAHTAGLMYKNYLQNQKSGDCLDPDKSF